MRTTAWFILLWLCLVHPAFADVNLPVYIEDAHTGSFYWIVRHISLTRAYKLILIDAHSDSNEILDSDSIRHDVLRAVSDNQLDSLTRQWRGDGTIQCFDWIEPLIPWPISSVCWVPAQSLAALQIEVKHREVADYINAHEMAMPRREGDYSGRYEIMDLDHFMRQRVDVPVIVTIDLDYFAHAESPARLERILDYVLSMKKLRAVTFAISRPYLVSDDQAHRLLYGALQYLTRVVNADIHYEPFATTGPDRSRLAESLDRQGLPVPRYDIEKAPACLRCLILRHAGRIEVDQEPERWQQLLTTWRADPKIPHISLSGNDSRISADRPFLVRIDNPTPGTRVRWKVLTAGNATYNLTGASQGYANDAPRFLLYQDKAVPAADDQVDVDGHCFIPFLAHGLGTLRVSCEVQDGTETYLSNVLCFSRYRGSGYVGKLTEIFNLPYVYGSALLKADAKISADARYGADCSHFLVYGRRRQGSNIPYLSPRGLLPYLREVDEVRYIHHGVAYGLRGPIAVTPDAVNRGLLLHFGKHMAAIYEDTDGRRLLTLRTRVVHQLEGYPEITTFGAMVRKYPDIRLMEFR